jgi:hypothetical protein
MGNGNKAREVEDILGAIAGVRDNSGSIATRQGKRQWQLPKPEPPPLPASRASLVRKAIVRMLLSSLPSFLVGVSRPIIISLNF